MSEAVTIKLFLVDGHADGYGQQRSQTGRVKPLLGLALTCQRYVYAPS